MKEYLTFMAIALPLTGALLAIIIYCLQKAVKAKYKGEWDKYNKHN